MVSVRSSGTLARTRRSLGAGPTVDSAAVMAHRDLAMMVRDRVARLVEHGKSEDEVVAAKATGDFDGKVQEVGTIGERLVR